MRPALTTAVIGLCCLHASYSEAVEFDGLSTFREIPASVSAALGDGSQASLSVWATLAAEGAGERQEIVVLTIKDSFVKFIVGFAEDDTIRVGARTRADEDSQGVRTVRAWLAGQELRIAATVDVALGEIRIFVNRERQETTGSPSWVATDFSRDVGARNTIGVTPYRQHYFHGALRDLGLYNRVLLEAEVRALSEDRLDAVSEIGLRGAAQGGACGGGAGVDRQLDPVGHRRASALSR